MEGQMEQQSVRHAQSSTFRSLLYLLPALHLSACLVIAIAKLESGWEQMIKIDFPFSVLLVALGWRLGHPFLWFGVLGTLWWYFLSWLLFLLIGSLRRGEP